MTQSRMTSTKTYRSQTRLTAADFGQLEQVGGIKLNPKQRERIWVTLALYEHLRRAEGSRGKRLSPKWIAKLERKICDYISVVEEISKTDAGKSWWHYVAFESEIGPTEEVKRLTFLVKACSRVHKELVSLSSGRRGNMHLPGLLFELERVFKEAGGRATGVASHDGVRVSRFVNFVHQASMHLPEDMWPKRGALLAKWERIYSARKRGEPEGRRFDWTKRVSSLEYWLEQLERGASHRPRGSQRR